MNHSRLIPSSSFLGSLAWAVLLGAASGLLSRFVLQPALGATGAGWISPFVLFFLIGYFVLIPRLSRERIPQPPRQRLVSSLGFAVAGGFMFHLVLWILG